MEYMIMPLQRYADFSGRSRRQEYWMYVLGLNIAFVVLVFVAAAIRVPFLMLLFYLGTLIPSIAVSVRRAHDQDKSGWFILIPIYGFIMMFLEGTRGPNRFGPDPVTDRGPDPYGHQGSSASAGGYGQGQWQGQSTGIPPAPVGQWPQAPQAPQTPQAPQATSWPPAPVPPASSWPPALPPAPMPAAESWPSPPATPPAAAWPPAPPASEALAPIHAPAPVSPVQAPAAASASEEPAKATHRACPFCAEEIRVEAIKCRFCGSQVEPPAAT